MENLDNFIQWGSDWIKVDNRVPYRYAIVRAKYGTGLQWVYYCPASQGQTSKHSHGNFYGDTYEEALQSCQAAINQLIELDQTGYWFNIWNKETPIKKKPWLK
jgi:predicted RNase H-like HicB family nuclease